MEKSTLSRNMRKLEDAGLIQMDQDPNNRTQKQAMVTEKGLELVLDAYTAWDEVQSRIRTSFGAEQFNQLLSLLGQLQLDLVQEFGEDLAM
jgi:DNA-binding MarR family transcriptional regulator